MLSYQSKATMIPKTSGPSLRAQEVAYSGWIRQRVIRNQSQSSPLIDTDCGRVVKVYEAKDNDIVEIFWIRGLQWVHWPLFCI